MIIGKRSCIGVFINETDRYFMEKLSVEISRAGEELGYNILFFSTVGFRGSDSEYDKQECAMFDFAPLERLDGIIVAPDTYQVDGFLSSLLSAIKKRVTCPIVTIRGLIEGVSSVFCDETQAIREIIRHIIKEHKAKHICFMAGYVGHYDSERRLECFLDEMKQHGQTLHSNAVFRGDMWKAKSEEAYHYFFDDEKNRPDAIICANDYMALGLLKVFNENAVRIPEDVILTGFDNVQDTQLCIPSLSSVDRDYGSMARKAVLLLDELIHEYRDKGHYQVRHVSTPTKMALRESCGCTKCQMQAYADNNQNLWTTLNDFKDNQHWEKYFLMSTGICETFDDVHRLIEANICNINELRDFYVCLYTEDEEQSLQRIYTEASKNVRLIWAFRDKKDCGIQNIVFNHDEILPDIAERDEPQTFYIMLLHYGSKAFGYTAVRYYNNETSNIFYHQWNVTIACVLQNISNIMKVMEISETNYRKSITDTLTGLLNRRGFIERISKTWTRRCLAGEMAAWIGADLDGLKYINDTFGHSEGDKAIHIVGEALQSVLPEGAVAARVGGDEFNVFIPNTNKKKAERYVRDVKAILKQLNQILDRAYLIGASIGIYTVKLSIDTDMDYCMQQSDIQMYIEKRKRKLNHHTGDEIN